MDVFLVLCFSGMIPIGMSIAFLILKLCGFNFKWWHIIILPWLATLFLAFFIMLPYVFVFFGLEFIAK
jgi:hypothetical protein